MDKAKHDHPSWTPPTWKYRSRSSLESLSAPSNSSDDGLTTRDDHILLTDRTKSTRKCCKCDKFPSNWKDASAARIKEGITYLRNFNGICNTGPKACVRISCSYNSAIFMCNDNDHRLDLSCAYMASYAQDILDDGCCKRPDFWLQLGLWS
ncbi:hypothetical protein ONS95_010162 [Cadophora gregata]|uniref:uncharacterized protein n=1 Tax=Cadophora gregata TaxID=51156 RepID=UPI0026DA9E30|nr:uncharacterized protein ONS95_010162 [Cadophora gregata]KAK0121884.1 hypothetical protein ONS95_010162 [Cadophora gregata]